MKTLVSSWLLLSSVLALVLSVVVFSQAADSSSTGGQNNGSTRPALRGPRALGPFTLFDTNHDSVISADEIANAPAALLKLDKNDDGELTPDELRPPGLPPPLPPEQ
ncbi:MAG: hypothetical protein WC661_14210 [Opitutaceae bacterium]|jgi:hypothetical protein